MQRIEGIPSDSDSENSSLEDEVSLARALRQPSVFTTQSAWHDAQQAAPVVLPVLVTSVDRGI